MPTFLEPAVVHDLSTHAIVPNLPIVQEDLLLMIERYTPSPKGRHHRREERDIVEEVRPRYHDNYGRREYKAARRTSVPAEQQGRSASPEDHPVDATLGHHLLPTVPVVIHGTIHATTEVVATIERDPLHVADAVATGILALHPKCTEEVVRHAVQQDVADM
ncbi:hypothetical protein H2203_001769 [Taxawa tesnikishii (nom. ined.)]|nr:hypothetical protein H2203_001769 [Dothideales sp. JES 119]